MSESIYPNVKFTAPNGEVSVLQNPEGGMTLRDMFAVSAIPALIRIDSEISEKGLWEVPESWGDVAASAYALADAMLAARSNTDQEAAEEEGDQI